MDIALLGPNIARTTTISHKAHHHLHYDRKRRGLAPAIGDGPGKGHPEAVYLGRYVVLGARESNADDVRSRLVAALSADHEQD